MRRTSSRCSICLYPVKMENAPKLLKIPKSECPDIWLRLPRHKWPKSSSSMEDPVVPLERNLYGHPLTGLLRERQFEKILLKYGWEKVSNWECFFVSREKGLFLSVYVDHHTCEYKQYCHVVILQNNADWDCFMTPILQEILRIQNLHQVEHYAFWEVIHLFQ